MHTSLGIFLAVLLVVLHESKGVNVMAPGSRRCHEPTNYDQFGTKSAYKPGWSDSGSAPSGCTPKMLWVLARHGATYPDREILNRMQRLNSLRDDLLRNSYGAMCDRDLGPLRNWQLRVSSYDQNRLSPQGKRDLKAIGEKIRKDYSQIFKAGYSTSRFVIQHNGADRNRESAEALAEGMFPNKVKITDAGRNSVLDPTGNCYSWQREAENKRSRVNDFKNHEEMRNMVQNISSSLGRSWNHDLNLEQVLTIYDMCRYEHALDSSSRSPWCGLFSEEDLKVLEYYDDMQSFYHAGPGNQYSSNLGAHVLNDMIDKFSNAEHGHGGALMGQFNLVDLDTITLAVSTLMKERIDDTETLWAHNYRAQKNTRLWRTSKLTPFAANLVAVLYKCDFEDRVSLKFNGQDILGSGFLSWSEFRRRMDSLNVTNPRGCL